MALCSQSPKLGLIHYLQFGPNPLFQWLAQVIQTDAGELCGLNTSTLDRRLGSGGLESLWEVVWVAVVEQGYVMLRGVCPKCVQAAGRQLFEIASPLCLTVALEVLSWFIVGAQSSAFHVHCQGFFSSGPCLWDLWTGKGSQSPSVVMDVQCISIKASGSFVQAYNPMYFVLFVGCQPRLRVPGHMVRHWFLLLSYGLTQIFCNCFMKCKIYWGMNIW